MNPALITAGLQGFNAAMRAAQLFAEAVNAANDGDEEAANEYLAEGREAFSKATDEWDAMT